MAKIDISEEEAIVIAEAIKVGVDSGNINDEYTAFNLLQRLKKEFPYMEYVFDFLDFEFMKMDDE